MSLGFALVHPQRLSAALDEAFPEKIGWDDGADLTLAATGLNLGDDPLGSFLSQLQAEALELLGELQGLFLPGGPFQAFADTLTGEGDGIAAWLRRIGGFLAGLDPLHLKATLTGHVDAFFDHFSAFDLSTLDDRLRRLAQQALDALRGPLLRGRDDGAAHRAFRAAALLLARLEPLFTALDAGLAPFDLRAAIKAKLVVAIDGLPRALLEGFAQVGRILRDDIGGMVEATASISVSVGPSGLVSGTPTHRDDADPQPFAKGHWVWWMDLLSSGVALFWAIWGFQRSRGLKRPTEWIEFLLASAWRIFRDTIRLFVQPSWLKKDSSGFVRMLFGEWGDFFVRLFLMLIGSIEDMVAWSNFVMSLGNRFLKWFALEFQPRLVYLYLRSVWYLRSWHDDSDTSTRGDPRFARVVWAGWATPLLLAIAVMGFFLPGESLDLQAFGKDNHGWATAGLVIAISAQILGTLFGPWILMGQHPFRLYSFDSFDFIALTVATFLVLFIGVETLGSTNVGATTGDVLRGVLYPIFGLTMALVIIGQCVQGASTDGHARWFEVIGAVQGWFVAILGAAGIGLVTMIVWWFIRRDGEDEKGDFNGLDVTTSPYRLPYPRDDMWFCGQGFHGIFSHTWRSAYEPSYSDNYFAYDFNNAFGKPACAARAGFVQQVTETNADGGGTPNRVQVQHWDWVAGHDKGTDQEHELTLALYLHLAQNRARCAMGQLVLQGYNLAAIDDTGISALNHLHFHVFTTLALFLPPTLGAAPASTNVSVTLPTIFGDNDARGFRSFGHIDGKPKALAYYVSENVGSESAAGTTTALTQPLRLTAAAVPVPSGTAAGHTHTLVIGPAELGTGGLPATLTLMTSEADGGGPTRPATGHAHSVTLTAAQLQALLARGVVQTDAAVGPIVDLTAAQAAAPALVSHQHTLRVVDQTLTTRRLPLVTPPGGRLIADAIAPLDLVGAHVAVDVDAQAANHWLLGAHRPVIAGRLALDRGPTGAASVSVGGATAVANPTVGAALSSARLAATLWTQTWGDPVAVRPEPVVVLESRARGSSAQVQISGAGLAVWNASGTQTGNGAGTVSDLETATVASLVPIVQAALGAGPGASPLSTAAGATLQILVGGAPAASFAGSSSRIAAVMSQAYDATTGSLRSDGALPLSAGRLVLDGQVVPILAAPARLRLGGTAAQLDPGTLLADPLVLTVLGATHTLVFRSSDVGASPSATLDLVASRIASEVDGVRAWRDADAVVVETVAAGPAATLAASKGATFSNGPVSGAAPVTGAVTVQDTTALTPAELQALIDDARTRAARTAASVASVTAAGGDIVVAFTPGIATPTLDASFGWTGAMTPAPDPASSAELRLTPPVGMTDPMWADLTVDGTSFRIAVDASAARVDLPPVARAAGAADTLTVTTAAGSQPVTVPAGTSLVDQVRAFAAIPGLTARVAWRWRVENVRFQSGDLTLSAVSPSALPGMGVFDPPATQLSAGPATEMVRAGSTAALVPGTRTTLQGIVGGSPDDDAPAFTAAAAANQVTLTPHAGMTLDVALLAPALPADATGLTASGASLVSTALTPGLLTQQTLVWRVSVLRDTQTMAETRVQFAAAPAKARAAKLAGATWTDTAGASAQLEVVAERGTLTITVTIPGSPDVDVAMPVDLAGAANLDEVVARISREAPLVEAFLVAGILQIQTRGAGTGWRLKLAGAATLASLGYDPTRFAADRTLSAQGGGQVRDLANATANELAAAFTAGAAAAAWPRALHFRVDLVGTTVQLRTLGEPITVTAEPPRLLAALAPAPVTGGVDIAVPTTLDLDQGWIKVMQGSELRHVVSVVGSRAAVEATDPLPSAAADVTTLLTTITGQALNVEIDGTPAPTFTVPAGLTSIDSLVAAMIRAFPTAHVRVVTRGDGPHFRISSRRRGRSSRVVVAVGLVADALGFRADRASDGGGQDPGLGTFDDLAAVSAADLKSALEEKAVEGGQGVLAAASTSTGVTLTPLAGQAQWESVPPYITSAASDPGGSTLWTSGGATPFRGPTLTHAWGARGPLVAQPLLFRVANAFPTPGSAVFDRRLIAALWANPARLGPWTLPANLATLDGLTLRLVIDAANVDVTFNGLAGTPNALRPAALVAAIEGATGGRVRVRVDASLRLESTDEGSAIAIALGAAPANDARSRLGNPAPVGATGTGNVGALADVSGDEIAAAVRDAFVIDSDAQQDASWSIRNPDNPTDLPISRLNVGRRLTLSSRKAGTASAVVPVILPSVLQMRRSMQRGPAHGAAVVLPALSGNVTLDGSLFITLNGGNIGPRAVPATNVEVHFAAGSYSPRRIWLRIDEELRGRGVGRAGIYPDGASGFRIAIESRLPGLQGSVKVPADAPPSNPDVVSRLVPGGPLFGRGWPGITNTSVAAATRGLRTANSGAGLIQGRTWRFTSSGGVAVPFQLSAADASLSQLAARLDGLLAAAGIGVARFHETDGCVYVELIDTAAQVAVIDAAGLPAAGLTTGIFGQPSLPPPKVGAMGDLWVDTGMQLRVTDWARTCRLVAFVFDGTAAGRTLDPGWVRITPDIRGQPQNTPLLRSSRYGVLIRSEGSRSDGYTPAGEMLVSTGSATIDGVVVPIVHQARYWFTIAGGDDGLGPVALASGEVLIEVAHP